MSRFLREFCNILTPLNAATLDKVTIELSVQRPMMSAYVSYAGHLVATFFFCIVTLAFLGWDLSRFVNAQNSEGSVRVTKMFSNQLSNPPTLRISVYCTNPPHCGAVSVVSNYSSASGLISTCASSTNTIAKDKTDQINLATNTFTAPLCFTGDPVFDQNYDVKVAGLRVDFAGVNPGEEWVWSWDNATGSKVKNGTKPDASRLALGVVEVRNDKTGELLRVVNLDSWQIKALHIGQRWTRESGGSMRGAADDVFARSVSYEGKYKKWRATLLILPERLVDLAIVERSPPTKIIWSFTGAATAAYLAVMIVQGLQFVFRGLFPGPAQIVANRAAEAAKGRELDATLVEPAVVGGGSGAGSAAAAASTKYEAMD